MSGEYAAVEPLARRLEAAPDGITAGELATWLYRHGVRVAEEGSWTPRRTDKELQRKLAAMGHGLARITEEIARVVWASHRAYESEFGLGERLAPWQGAPAAVRQLFLDQVAQVLRGEAWDGESLHGRWKQGREAAGLEWGEIRSATTHPWIRPWSELSPMARQHFSLTATLVIGLAPEGLLCL